jgi:cytochrome P450
MLERLSALPATTPLLLLAAIPILLFAAYRYVHYKRFVEYSHIPQLPPSLIWGHLAILPKLIGGGNPKRDADMAFKETWLKLGRPPFVLFDIRPLMAPMLVVGSHEVAEQVSRSSKQFPWALPKSPTMKGIQPLVGTHSILTMAGEEWKTMRKRFNPGFNPTHLMTLLPCILDSTMVFLKHLDDYAASGEDFRSETLLVNLTFDIIGKVVMDIDFHAQETKDKKSEMIKLYGEMLDSYSSSGPAPVDSPWMTWKRYKIAKKIDTLLRANVKQKFAQIQERRAMNGNGHAGNGKPGKLVNDDVESATATRNMTTLSLQDVEVLDDFTLQSTCDQLKTFLLAGHDTTAILLQWWFYESTRSPDVKAKVIAELDSLFGPSTDPAVVRAQLLERGDELVKKMTYTSAVVKELLRMYAPAGTARMAKKGTGFRVHTPDGRDVCLDGMVIYNCANIIQRDPEVYGPKADIFYPERWLGNSDTSMDTNSATDEKSSGIPASAWRPFERGPRNCIGQELANIEARVILACVVRRYDFVKVGLGELDLDESGKPVMNEFGQYKVKSEMYSYRQVTPKPVGGMQLQVKLSERAKKEMAAK